MSWYNDLRYISLLSIRFCRSEGNRTSGGIHICPCSSYNPFAFILLIGCKDSHLIAISNLPVEISADFVLDIKYLQCHFSNFCWTVVLRYNELINREEYSQLREINSVRNLILHGGNIQRVPRQLLENLIGYKEKIKNLDVLRKS